MNRRLLANVALAAASLLLTALALEVALRLVLVRGSLNPFVPDEEIGFRLKTDFSGVYPRVAVFTDGRGRRIAADGPGARAERLLFVGDSVTFGFGVLAEEAFPHVVGELLGEPESVANAGVPGYNLVQVLRTIRDNAAVVRPERIVYGLVINDVAGAASMSRYEDIDPQAARGDGPLARSVLIAFIGRRWQRLETRLAGVESRAGNRSTRARDLGTELDAGAIAAFDEQWHELEALQEQLGVPIDVVVLPYAAQIDEDPGRVALQEFIAPRCAASSLRCLDPRPAFLEHADEGLFNPGSSYHLSPRGHALLAEWLVREVPLRPSP